jgi:hypothetical protein
MALAQLLEGLPAGFWSGSLAVGASLAADAVIATFGVAASIGRRWAHWAYWTLGVVLTHWLFPMIGLSAGWIARDRAWLVRCVYLVGALLLARHLQSNVVRALQPAGRPARAMSYGDLSLVILAVSLDALLAGPAQSVVARDWDAAQLLLSSAVVATVVLTLVAAGALACIATLAVARDRGAHGGPRGLVAVVAGAWTLEVAVFSGFAVLALASALFPGAGGAVPVAVAVGLAVAGGVWLAHGARILHHCRGIAGGLLAGRP